MFRSLLSHLIVRMVGQRTRSECMMECTSQGIWATRLAEFTIGARRWHNSHCVLPQRKSARVSSCGRTVDTRWTLDGHSMDTTMDTTMDTIKTRGFGRGCVFLRNSQYSENFLEDSPKLTICRWGIVSIVVSIVVSIECPSCVHRESVVDSR